MGFDVDAYLAARTPWTLTLGGTTYTAAWISVDVVRRFEAERTAAGEDVARQLAAVRRLLRALFPWRPHYVWRGDPVTQLLALDAPALGAVLTDFFQSWLRVLAPGTPPQSPPTSGIASKP